MIKKELMKRTANLIRGAVWPGLTVGLFIPLLISRAPKEYFRLLPALVPASLAAVFALVLLLDRLAVKGDRGEVPGDAILSTLNPLIMLNLGHLVFIVDVPAIPFFVAAAVFCVFCLRIFSHLAGGVLPPRTIELMVLLVPFSAAFFVLFQTNITHDAFQYLGMLVSMARDFDLNFYNEVFLMNADRFYNPFALNSARYLGVPLLEAPFFAAGHVLAWFMGLMGNSHATTGTTFPYIFMTGLASSFFGLGGLVLIYMLCRRFFSRGASLMGTLGYWLASPLIFFSFSWNGWPHPFNTFFSALFLLYFVSTRGRKKTVDWIALGAIGGILCLIRPTNVLLAVFPLFEIGELYRKRKGPAFFAAPLWGALAALIVFSPQITLWKSISGSFWYGPYREIGDFFDWLHPDFYGVLFSTAQHGLFAWTPLLLPAFFGLFFMTGKDRAAGMLSMLVVALHLYIYSSWSVWWTGIGFSNRFFADLSPFFALGTAALVRRAEGIRFISRKTIAGVLSLFAAWNIFLIGEYRALLIPYGIPDPGRVVDEPLTLAGIIHNHLYVFPEMIGSLFSSRWSNENFFSARLMHSGLFGQPRLAVAVILAFTVCVVLFCITARFLLNGKTGAFFRKRMKAVLAVTFILVAVLHGSIIGASRNTVPIGNFIHVDKLDIHAGRYSENASVLVDYPRPVINVDVLSYLVYGHDIAQGEKVAVISIHDADGRRFDYTMQGGLETAEHSYPRPEYVQAIKHDITGTVVLREKMEAAYSRHIYPSLTFWTRLQLPEPLMVEKITISYLHDRGELVVSDIFLRDF